MKLKLSLLTLGLAVFVSGTTMAQDYKVSVQNTKDGKLSLSNFPGEIVIEGYSGSEIVVSSNREMKTPEKAKGLKPVYGDGTDNTGIGVAMEKNGNQVTLKCLLSLHHRGKYKIRVPDNFSVKADVGCERSGDITVENMKNEIEIQTCQSIKLKNVSGPLVLSTISGDIDVTFSEFNKEKPISLATISGEIDIRIPANAPVNIDMSTISGAFYSDFDFSNNSKDLPQVGGSKVKKQLNGGGTDLKLHTISGSIFLRKS
jgi:lia operon protein LiaG